jgi:outer membrane lipoprotein-sorting protein
LAALLFVAIRAAAEQPAPPNLRALLAAYAEMPGLEAEFTEEKHLALLAKPLENRGRIYFARPGYLLRRVEAPLPASVVVTPTEVRLSDGEGSKTIDLRARKDVRPFVQSLLWLLTGDYKSITHSYEARYQRARGDGTWRLSLKPKGEPLSRLVAAMNIRGQGLSVAEIEVLETSGDKTITRITSANPARRFDAEERVKLFGERAAAER